MHDMPFSEAELELALERFVSRDLATAELGYNTLCDFLRILLPAHLQKCGRLEATDDIIQGTLVKLWTARPTYKNQGVRAFIQFSKKIATNCATDLGRKDGDQPPGEGPPEQADVKALKPFDRIFQNMASIVHRAANQEWLTEPPGIDEIEWQKRVLTVTAVLVDKMPPRVAWRMWMGTGFFEQATLAEWMDDPAILLRVAYDALYRDGDQIIAHLLGLPDGVEIDTLNDLYMRARTHDERVHPEFTNMEVAEMFLHYRYEETVVHVLSMTEKSHTNDDLENLFERCDARLPFLGYMEELKSSFGPRHASLLSDPGLWKRLVFQYGVIEGFPQKEVARRTRAAANAADYRLTVPMINIGISGRRLINDLRPRLKRMMDGYDG